MAVCLVSLAVYLLLYPLLVQSLSDAATSPLSVSLPLSAQYPPVARPGVAYAFSFSPFSFSARNGSDSSDASQMGYSTPPLNYTAQNIPEWATFDSASFSLIGTPPSNASDGSWNITVSALGGSQTVSSSFELFLSTAPPPVIGVSIMDQLLGSSSSSSSSSADLQGCTALPSGSGVLVPTSAPFSLSFLPSLFALPGDPTSAGWTFAAVESLNARSLPSWLTWDSSNLTISGTAPSDPITLPISILVSSGSYPNSREAEAFFVIEIGSNGLELISDLRGVNTTVGDHIKWAFFPQGLQMNGTPVDPNAVEAEWDFSDVPWLSFDSQSRLLTGTTPSQYINGTAAPIQVPLMLTISSAPPFPTTVPVYVHPYQFVALSLPSVNVSAGAVNYSFASFMRNPASSNLYVEAFLNPAEASQWLSLSEDATSLIGVAPINSSYDHVDVELLAWDEPSNLTSTSSFVITLSGNASTSGSSSSPNSNDGNSSNGQLSDGAANSSGISGRTKIALVATFATLPFLIIVALLLFCMLRRRRNRDQDGSVREKGIGRPQRAISTVHSTKRESAQRRSEGGFTSSASSPTLRVSLPPGTSFADDLSKSLNFGDEPTESHGVDHGGQNRAHTPEEQLRAMYPNAFLPSDETCPPNASLLASDSQDTYIRAPAVTLPLETLRQQFGVTASGSEQVRMIDAAVRYSISDRPPNSEEPIAMGEDEEHEARRSRLMSLFASGPQGFFKSSGETDPFGESIVFGAVEGHSAPSVPENGISTPIHASAVDDGWTGRQYDAFGRLVKRPTEGDVWARGSEPRALGTAYLPDHESQNPFGRGLSSSTLGLDHSLPDHAGVLSETDPGLGDYTDEDEDEDFGDAGTGEEHGELFEASEVRKATVVDIAGEMWRTADTPRIVQADDDWASANPSTHASAITISAFAPPLDSMTGLGYPVSTLYSPSMSIRLIHSAGPALSPDSVSSARLGQSSIFPTSTPVRAVRSERLADSIDTPRRPKHERLESTESTSSKYATPLQPYRFLARAAEAFHFYPVLYPPPRLIPTSSRSSSSIRSSYLLQPDPDCAEGTNRMPDWLHWDAGELKLWGHPGREDAHCDFAMKIVERTVIPPGSPVKGRDMRGSVEEKIVSRLVIVVAAPLSNPGR